MTKDVQKVLTMFERDFYAKNRAMVLHIIGPDYLSFHKSSGLTIESILNFMRYEHDDYNAIRGKKAKRYLTVINCIRILERSGYLVEVEVKLR